MKQYSPEFKAEAVKLVLKKINPCHKSDMT